jgi:hypothetical protein
MAKYNVTYRCGHQETVQLFGKYKDRYNKIAYYETIDCPACRAAAAKEIGLTGSDKQVAWALDIRKGFMIIKAEFDKMVADKGLTSNPKVMAAVTVLNDTANNTDAKFWIDNRYNLSTMQSVCQYIESK